MKVEIEAGSTPRSNKVLVDGVDITSACQGAFITIFDTEIPKVGVTLLPTKALLKLDAKVYKIAGCLRTEREQELLNALRECYDKLRHPGITISVQRLVEIESIIDSAESAYDRD